MGDGSAIVLCALHDPAAATCPEGLPTDALSVSVAKVRAIPRRRAPRPPIIIFILLNVNVKTIHDSISYNYKL